MKDRKTEYKKRNSKMKKAIYLIYYLILLFDLYSCSFKEQEYKSFKVEYYKEVPFGFCYNESDKIIEYEGKTYLRKMIGYYKNEKLKKLDIFKSEGVISYSYKELKADKILAKYIEIPLNRKIVVLQDSLIDNGIVYTYERKIDSVFVKHDNGMVIVLL